MSEQEVVFESGGLHLSGTLASGAEPRRGCVIMVAGSGQVDRDENAKHFGINVFNELSRHLAERGLASLRYDKRGVGKSQGDFWSAGLTDNAADVAAAVEFVRADRGLGRGPVFLLGHSEGAYLAAKVAAQTPGLAGVVLLAGGARPCEQELRWQAGQIAKGITGFNAFLIKLLSIDVLKAQAKQIEKVKRSTTDWFRVQLVAKVNAKWMREFLDYDPAADLASITCPVLAIAGAKDIQVSPDNLAQMRTLVTAPFESHVVPDVTHILRADAGPPRLAAYREQAKRPLDPRVVELVTGWLERQVAPEQV